MAEYKAPLRDMRFVLKEVLDVDSLWSSLPALQDIVDVDTADAILEEAAKITQEQIAPLNRESDEQGSVWVDGQVTSPAGFKEAYQTYSEGGWVGLAANPEYEGMGMPKILSSQVEEMTQGACMSFGLAPMLAGGASLSIDKHADAALKEKFLPKMHSGQWAAAMDLTEPHAGTDLGMIRTKAEPNGDGSYRLTGTKIFITWGEHDMAENIIHLVLAKLPDAPAGSRGISLFLVPKMLVNDDGSIGERNSVSCGSIEKKMGIKGSATCVMNYDEATGWLVGEPNKGLACMFTMMNYERLGVGIQALGASQASYLNAVEYARERIQSRSPEGVKCEDKAADPIIVHPDVRRMLLTMKAYIEGGRAFSAYTAKWLDLAKYTQDPEEKAKADALSALLTPVVKAFVSDKGLEVTILGQQVFGGHGFVREWGQEQLVRDVRITQIYEGTNGIQALDLIGRKTLLNGGKFFQCFVDDVETFAGQHKDNAAMAEFVSPLLASLEKLQQVTDRIMNDAASDPNAAGAAAMEYLHLFGYTAYAYMWAMMVNTAQARLSEDEPFYSAKIKTARFFFKRLLPTANSLAESISAGSDTLMSLDAESF